MRFLKGYLLLLILLGAAVQAEESILARLEVEAAIRAPNRVGTHHTITFRVFVASADTAVKAVYEVDNWEWNTDGGPGEGIGHVDTYAVPGLEELTPYWFWMELHDQTTGEVVKSPRIWFRTESFENLQNGTGNSLGLTFDSFKAGVVGFEITNMPPPPSGKLAIMPYSVYLEQMTVNLTPVSWGTFKVVVTGF